MISKLRVVNFRQIKDQTIDLAQAVVIAGPNNGGKTTLLQAISLFAIAVRSWSTNRVDKKSKAQKRSGVAINLEALLNIPITEFKELWHNLIVREGVLNSEGKPTAKNIKIEIHAEGFTNSVKWAVGFEFDYGRDSLIYTRMAHKQNGDIYDFPEVLVSEHIGYLPSVAGLSPTEDKLETGSILRHIGNGKTADVLRNICFLLYEKSEITKWEEFRTHIKSIFAVELNKPVYSPVSGLLKMTYNEGDKKNIDLSSLGSGTKQAILLFAYLMAFPNTVNLLDEPDAHLEVIRQSSIYDKISDLAKRNNAQIIIASHSESVINRAFGKDLVLSGVFGRFEIVNHKPKVISILRDIGYEQFIIAKQRPRILYFEGSTDLDFLKTFSKKLSNHQADQTLDEKIYPYPVANDVNRVKKHFSALKSFIPELKGYAIFDNLDKTLDNNQSDLIIRQWSRNEIENYLPMPSTLVGYINSIGLEPLFVSRFLEIVAEFTPPVALNDRNNKFWIKTKISDDYLTPIFEKFWDEIGYSRNSMDKSKYYHLCEFVNISELSHEIGSTIDEIVNHFFT